MTIPSPERGIFRWAWYQAAQHRTKFWVAAVTFTGILSAIGAFIALPPNPNTGHKALAALIALAATTVVVVAGTYVLALLAAPYQQRNALRRTVTDLQALHAEELATATATIRALETAPVSPDHARRLHEISAELKDSVEKHQPLEYGRDGDTWQRAFGEHFPLAHDLLGYMDGERAAFDALRDRLRSEALAVGMGEPPWQLEEFVMRLADIIAHRSMTGLLRGYFDFDWKKSGGAMYLGDPVRIFSEIRAGGFPRIFLVTDPTADVDVLKRKFEQFMMTAESWPEAANIRESFEIRVAVAKLVIPRLEEAANTDPITSRCFLCRGPQEARST